jgi:hypothetical protein
VLHIFEKGSPGTICPGLTSNHLMSASWVAGITSVSHQFPAHWALLKFPPLPRWASAPQCPHCPSRIHVWEACWSYPLSPGREKLGGGAFRGEAPCHQPIRMTWVKQLGSWKLGLLLLLSAGPWPQFPYVKEQGKCNGSAIPSSTPKAKKLRNQYFIHTLTAPSLLLSVLTMYTHLSLQK